MRAGADARSVFEGTSPPPSPVPAALVSRPGCCPREGFPLPFLLHFPLRFRGPGRKIGEVVCSLATSLGCRRPRTFPGYHILGSPCPADPFLAARFHPAFPCCFPGRLGPDVSLAFSPLPGLGPAARSCLPQPPSRGPQPPPTPPHGPGAMSELEQLRQEAEQLRNQIRVRAWWL